MLDDNDDDTCVRTRHSTWSLDECWGTGEGTEGCERDGLVWVTDCTTRQMRFVNGLIVSASVFAIQDGYSIGRFKIAMHVCMRVC